MKLGALLTGAALILPTALAMPKSQFCRTLAKPDCGKGWVCVPIAAGCTTTTDCLGMCRSAKKYSAIVPVVEKEKAPVEKVKETIKEKKLE
ncbi:hypothetical protein HYQ45_000910 [Verticillium longisporum]|nr:hypothetical protein HYQ45_000910 [Verticillium longisporum]